MRFDVIFDRLLATIIRTKQLFFKHSKAALLKFVNLPKKHRTLLQLLFYLLFNSLIVQSI